MDLVSPRITALAAVATSLTLLSCAAKPPRDKGPMGVLPAAVTSAEPEWIPFTIRAGRALPSDPRERRFGELRQLTFDGTSGAPRWHPDGRQLVYESGRSANSCGELRRLDLSSGASERLSPDRGWASAGAFSADGTRFLFTLSKATKPPCPHLFDGLRWTLPQCDIHAGAYARSPVGGAESLDAPTVVIESPAYDAELDASADGQRVVFTSMRDGDPDLYIATPSGQQVRRITATPGYDGGARFSPDGSRLVWQAERLNDEAVEAYQEQLAQGSVEPRSLAILLAGSEGQHQRVIVSRSGYNITPSFLPDSRHVLFASDYDDPAAATGKARNFELYLVDPEGPATATGTGRIERVTYQDDFDGDGHISPNGQYLVFTSSRMATTAGGTNLFIARWLDGAEFR